MRLVFTGVGGPFTWLNTVVGGSVYRIKEDGGAEFDFEADGDFDIEGNFISNGMTLMVPDYVFEPDYDLMPLSELQAYLEQEKHLPNIPSVEEINKDGLNLTQMQLKLLEKIEELTLYTIEQQQTIKQQQQTIEQQQQTIEAILARLAALEETREAGQE